MIQIGCSDLAQERLMLIKAALAEVIRLADEGEEYLISAIICDGQNYVEARLQTLSAISSVTGVVANLHREQRRGPA